MDRHDVKDKIDKGAKEAKKTADKVGDKSKDVAYKTGAALKKAGNKLQK